MDSKLLNSSENEKCTNGRTKLTLEIFNRIQRTTKRVAIINNLIKTSKERM